jgi:hypothetical protein
VAWTRCRAAGTTQRGHGVERHAQHVLDAERRERCRHSRGYVVTCLQSSKEIKDHEFLIVGGVTTKVIVSIFRHAVNLDEKTCSCRVWQVTGQPYNHGLSNIAKLSREVHMEDFVHEYYSVDRLRKTHASAFNPMKSKH